MNFRSTHACLSTLAGLSAGLFWLTLMTGSLAHADTVETACRAPLDAEIAAMLPDLTDADLTRAATAIASELDAIGELVPRSLYDSLEVVSENGFDPELLRQWMKREVRLLSYQGTLRGARGVVLDRQGNSLDQSLLMAEMLTFAGFDVRLARTQLEAATAAALAENVATFRVTRTADIAKPQLAGLFAKLGIPDANAARIQEALRVKNADCSAAIADRIDAQTKALIKLIGTPDGIRADPGTALADHWWVQANLGQGWQDIDPYSDIVGARQPDSTMAVNGLSDDLRHVIGIRLKGEFRTPGGLREETFLEHSVPAADIAFVSSELYNGAAPGQQRDTDPEARDPVAGFFEATAATRVWLPVLRIGDDRYTGSVFSVDGGVEAATDEMAEALQQAGPGGLSKGLGGLLGGGGGLGGNLLGGGAEKAPEPEPLTALWLEVETIVPGRGTRMHRRDLYDALGTAARRAGDHSAVIDEKKRGYALMFRSEIGVTAGTLAPEAATRMQAQSAAEMVRAMEDILAGRTPRDVTLPSSATSFANMRTGAAPTGQIGDVAPGVVLIHQGFRSDENGETVYVQSIDIAENAVTSPSAVFAAHVRAGVADTVVETLLGNLGGSLSNTSVRFVEASEQWTILQGTDGMDGLALTDDTLARVASDLAAGFVVVAPTRGDASETYWRIDPNMGTTLGIGAMGHGANLTEEGLLYQSIKAGQYIWELHPFVMCMLLGHSKKVKHQDLGGCFAAAGMFWAAGRTTGAVIPTLTGSPIKRFLLWFGAQIVILFGEDLWHQSQTGEKWEEWKQERIDAVLGR
ncbi:MAG: hypothetical protein AAF479_09035 [Pseudomonadota bacterium]